MPQVLLLKTELFKAIAIFLTVIEAGTCTAFVETHCYRFLSAFATHLIEVLSLFLSHLCKYFF
jgi:hypothetical protein